MYIALGLLAVACIALVAFGWRGVRQGDTPHCRRCDYNLTGNETGQCPECGRPVEQGVVFGERRRRRIPIVIGLIGMLVVGGMGYVQFRNVSILKSLPNSAVSFLARWGSKDAFDEAMDRLEGKLTDVDEALLLEAFRRARECPSPATGKCADWCKLLVRAWYSGNLSGHEAQYCEFFLDSPTLIVEPMFAGDKAVRASVEFSLPCAAASEAEDLRLWITTQDERMRIQSRCGGDPVDYSVTGHGYLIDLMGLTFRSNKEIHCAIHAGDYMIDYSGRTCLRTTRGTGTACCREFTLQERATASPLEFGSGDLPDMAATIRESLEIGPALVSHDNANGAWFMFHTITIRARKPAPTSMAFEVFAVSEGAQAAIGTLCTSEGDSRAEFEDPENGVDLDGQEFNILLRFSPDVARECKIQNAWVGEVDLGPYYLEPLPPKFRRSGGQ
ncbi:MAG: hypothetical protein J5J06_18970 [Phycisphaerae bacterium]|nr:hypothetical protein [Phycisphaerae bacterium]